MAALGGAVFVLASVASLPAMAENWRVTPSIGLTETLTDNVELEPAGSKRGDLVSRVSPGLRVAGTGARLRLDLDYRLDALIYARDSGRNENRNNLRASGLVEAIEDWLFIDASASITQQNVSAFRAQGSDSANVDRNRAETSSYRLSPYVQGRLGGLADYQVRYTWTMADAGTSNLGATQTHRFNANVKGITGLTPLTWSLAADYNKNANERGRDTESDRIQAFLNYRFDPQLRLTASVGREANDFVSIDRKSKTTYGAGFDWAPTERTQLAAFREERFFGAGHALTFTHRTPRTSWRISDRKDTQTLNDQLATVGQGTAFDLLFNALAGRFPDPALRAAATELLLSSRGIPSDLNVPLVALTNRVFVERRREISVALLGARNTVTLTAHRSERRGLGGEDLGIDDFSLSTDVRQRGFSASWAHDLSALTSLNLLSSWTDSKGTTSSLETSQWSLRLLLSTQIGPKTTGSLGLRHVRFEDSGSDANSYRENAVTATVTHRF